VSGAIEGAQYIKSKHRVFYDFSEKQSIDCVRDEEYGSNGCEGGYPLAVFSYYQKFEPLHLYRQKDPEGEI